MEIQEAMARRGCVPGQPFARIIQEWQEREEESIFSLAQKLGFSDVEGIRKVGAGKRMYIGFDLADKIVAVCTDGFAWLNDPELRSIYQGFDLSWLDLKKPCAA
jgi:hypothetical protein